jgi:hypothetical protein
MAGLQPDLLNVGYETVKVFGLEQNKAFTTKDTNDCKDAGGRATHGAVAENTKFLMS